MDVLFGLHWEVWGDNAGTEGSPQKASLLDLPNLPVHPGSPSWDLASKVISTSTGVISNYKYSYLNYNSGN